MDTKICWKCFNILPIENFGVNLKSKDGYSSWCRQCRNKNAKKYKEQNAISHKKYYHKIKNKKSYKIKKNIRNKTYTLILQEKIKKHKCKICGSINVEAHHINYKNAKNIEWLCKKHHNQLHYKYFNGASLRA
jgi:hypothetical protein